MKLAIAIMLAIAVILVGCAQQATYVPHQNVMVKNYSIALKEAARLVNVLDSRNLTLQDVSLLGENLDENLPVIDDFRALQYFIAHNETKHVGHEILGIHYFLLNGKLLFCPSDEANHIAIYLKYGDNERAQEKESEFITAYPQWFDNANKTRAKVTTAYKDLDALDDDVSELELAMITENYTEARTVAQWIADRGYC
ncbi:MAG TPA: hypothetical protein VGQ00_03445 [Candidatus Norongarragalinales archaeon]|jgi:hypothetical protein|nr:hypothetical protein [Candidatus Norongarragalinales archaeon]